MMLDALVRVLFITVFLIILLWITMAEAQDNWRECDQAYKFCNRQPYHRDCKIWTAYDKPLSIDRSYYPAPTRNPAIDTPFCVENPWHMHCGYIAEMPPLVHEHIECPMPGPYEGK